MAHLLVPSMLRTYKKIVGAGGGGFLLFYAEQRQPVREAVRTTGPEEVRVRFDFEGTKVLFS